MKNKIFLVFIFVLLSSNIYSQTDNLSSVGLSNGKKDAINWIAPASLVWPFNPMVVFEDEKTYFAFTKEVAIALPPISLKKAGIFTRLAVEYSYVFRSEKNHHIRLSLDAGYPLSAGDFAAVLLSAGSGYFTDTKANGISVHSSLGFFTTFGDNLGVNFYLRTRNTFMFPEERKNIFDLSAGLGLSIYPF